MSFRDLTDDEKVFIEEKLKNRSVEFEEDVETDSYVKVKKENNKVGKTLWTFFRPRNWAILVGVISLILVYFVIFSVKKINNIMNTGVIELISTNDQDFNEVFENLGLNKEYMESLIAFYNSYPQIIALILVCMTILVAGLLMLDVWMNNKRGYNEE